MQISAPFFAVWRERAENGGVVHHQHVRISHEQLETGHALAHHVVHVFQTRAAQVGDDHVQAEIDAGFALGLFPPGVQSVAHACAARWMAKSTMVVVPPNAAARVPVSKSSLDVVPPNGMSRCVCASIPPGSSSSPEASNHSITRFRRDARAHLLDLFALHQDVGGRVDSAVTTVPFRINMLIIAVMRCSQIGTARPVSTRSIVMHPSTGQTSAHRLQPTHSSSSTRGMRPGGVAPPLFPVAPSSFAMGVMAIRAALGLRLPLALAAGVAMPRSR
jgi:hypothetical protein